MTSQSHAWKESVFSRNTGKYGPEITSYLDTFHEVKAHENFEIHCLCQHSIAKYKTEWRMKKQTHAALEYALAKMFQHHKYQIVL